jgi:hypothetical protein
MKFRRRATGAPAPRTRRVKGQAMVEYIVVSAALAFAIFVMVSPDVGLPLISYFLQQLGVAIQKFLYALSTPF